MNKLISTSSVADPDPGWVKIRIRDPGWTSRIRHSADKWHFLG